MSSYYNIAELNASIQNTFTIGACLIFQKFFNLNQKFSSHLFVPLMTHLLPLYVWYSMLSYQGSFPDWKTCLEQLLSTVAKIGSLYLVVLKYPDNEEMIAAGFLMVTHVGMLYPELYSHDKTYHIHLRFAEDTLILNMVSHFCYLRSLQQADAKNSNEIESNVFLLSEPYQSTRHQRRWAYRETRSQWVGNHSRRRTIHQHLQRRHSEKEILRILLVWIGLRVHTTD
jgi:hypothetical protein